MVIHNIYLLLLFTVFKAYPQTEFYLSTHEQLNTGCQKVVEEQPYKCEIPYNFTLNAIMWNPDSIEWCTTKEGRSRTRSYMQGIMWQYDGMTSDRTLSDHNFWVLDTLTHTVTATILSYPTATFSFKGINSNYQFNVCSKSIKIFENDSVKMTIQSTNPAVYSEEETIPLIENITGDDSNKAIINISYLNESGIAIDTLLNKEQSENDEIIAYPFKALKTYSPALNSYSVHVPLSFHKYASHDYHPNPPADNMIVFDTLGVVVRKNDTKDTLQLQFKRLFYGDTSRSSVVVRRGRNHSTQECLLQVYDLKGRIVKNNRLFGKVKTDLSNGLYIYQIKGVDGILFTKKCYYNQNDF